MAWVRVNIPHHLLMDNPAKVLADKLNEINAGYFVLLSDINENIDGVAWVKEGE